MQHVYCSLTQMTIDRADIGVNVHSSLFFDGGGICVMYSFSGSICIWSLHVLRSVVWHWQCGQLQDLLMENHVLYVLQQRTFFNKQPVKGANKLCRWLVYFAFWNEILLWSHLNPCVFSYRSFSDSCFLSSPLCSELADVQWYGHDKAKPGTLVWDLPKGPRRVPLPSPTAPPLSITTTHWQPTTSSVKPYKNPALTRLAGWIWAHPLLPKSCTPSISSPLHYTPLSQLSLTGTHSLGFSEIWFHRDRLRRSTSAVEL